MLTRLMNIILEWMWEEAVVA